MNTSHSPHHARPNHARPSVGAPAATPVRLAAAAAVLVGGLVHLQLYFDGYRDVPNDNFGRSFVANGIISVLLAVALVVRTDVLVRLAAIGVSVGTLAAFAMSRTDSGIFGFAESGLEPSPQAGLTLVTEIGAIALLALGFVPRIGPGRPLDVRVAAPVALAVVALAGVMSVLWNQTPDGPDGPDVAVDGSAPPTDAPGEPPSGDPVVGGSTIDIAEFAFAPAELTVGVGGSVTWTNQDSFSHTASGADSLFDSGNLGPGASFSFTFDTAGTFTYICLIHPSMTGSVVVTP